MLGTAEEARTNIFDVLQWTTTHAHTSVGRTAKTHIHHFHADTACSPEDLPTAMVDSNEQQARESERVRQTESKRERGRKSERERKRETESEKETESERETERVDGIHAISMT